MIGQWWLLPRSKEDGRHGWGGLCCAGEWPAGTPVRNPMAEHGYQPETNAKAG